jgi:hypothetical protein
MFRAGTTGRQENCLKSWFMAFHSSQKDPQKGVTSWATSSNLTSFLGPPIYFLNYTEHTFGDRNTPPHLFHTIFFF